MRTLVLGVSSGCSPASRSRRRDSDADSYVTQARRVALMKDSEQIYKDRCSGCHQENGLGVPRVYPPLANNEAILMRNPVNAIRVTLNGGFPPSTQGNPRPYGMPPPRTC